MAALFYYIVAVLAAVCLASTQPGASVLAEQLRDSVLQHPDVITSAALLAGSLVGPSSLRFYEAVQKTVKEGQMDVQNIPAHCGPGSNSRKSKLCRRQLSPDHPSLWGGACFDLMQASDGPGALSPDQYAAAKAFDDGTRIALHSKGKTREAYKSGHEWARYLGQRHDPNENPLSGHLLAFRYGQDLADFAATSEVELLKLRQAHQDGFDRGMKFGFWLAQYPEEVKKIAEQGWRNGLRVGYCVVKKIKEVGLPSRNSRTD